MRTAIHEVTKLGQKLGTRLAGPAVLTLAFLLSAWDAPGATPPVGRALVNPPTGGFAIDGDLRANTPTGGIGDWVPGPSGTGGAVLLADGTPVNPNTTFHLVDVFNSGTDNNFAGGNKVNYNPDTPTSGKWQWVSNPVGDKV